VPVNTLLTADDYAYMLEHSRAQAALVSGALLPALKAALVKSDHEVNKVVVSRPVAPVDFGEVEFEGFLAQHAPSAKPAPTRADDPAFWLYSSGSTGRPKGTVHSHANPYWTCELYGKAVLQLQESDVCFSAAKLFFAYGLGNALTFPMCVGASVILMPERPTPEATFKRLRGEVPTLAGLKPTVFYGAPTGFAGMLASTSLPTRAQVALRLVSSAGEALPAELGEKFKKHFGVDIVDGIGSTEMLHIFISNRPDCVRYGTTGWSVPGYEIQLRGDDGGPVPDGEPGDLYVQGPSSAMMYWGNREKTRDTFQGGWTKSGDKYIRNADGSFTYGGRSDDMLKVSGIYVSPFEVEATLVQHPAVLEAAVIGVLDAEGLTKAKAFVVLKSGSEASEAELKSFVKDKLAPYKYPRQIAFIAELPKTATGKIQRFKLRSEGTPR
jgi:benzoate-CoA ligase